jgi:hypothetical protein
MLHLERRPHPPVAPFIKSFWYSTAKRPWANNIPVD